MDYDDIVIGAGHNGLVAACTLARAGRKVLVLEGADHVGGAAISAEVFDGVPARLSKYAYLISLLPKRLLDDLGIELHLVKRGIASYTPDPADPTRGLAVPVDGDEVLNDGKRLMTGSVSEADAWRGFYGRTQRIASRAFDTLLEPLRSREDFKASIDPDDWRDFFERPLGEVIERTFHDDIVRGVVLTDALIGTFASANDPSLQQNICFLYHVIGNGTGDWDVPVGGMGAFTEALAARARELGAEIRLSTPVTSIAADGTSATVHATGPGGDIAVTCSNVLANCAPAVLDGLLGRTTPQVASADAGAQVKVNMLLTRLPKLKDTNVDPDEAFRGTFHINETYSQLEAAYQAAAAGRLPEPMPAEIYCHSIADPTILAPELQAAGAQTLTLFALHTPHALFEQDNDRMRDLARERVLASLNSVLAEPIEDVLWRDANGRPCIEVNTTVDVQDALDIPTGNIFHTPLQWPFAEHEDEVGRWGVETDIDNVFICGSGARRGGAVSGVPGHNAARAVLG